MARVLLVLAVLVGSAVACRAEQPTANPETLIRFTLSPAPIPRPALRYRLLPELKEMNPGNPVQGYMKCMLEQQSFFFDKEAYEHREKLLAMPLKELPAQELLQEYGRVALSHVDRAARLDNPDWQVLQKLKSDGMNLLLPEVQAMRSLARALQVRFRAEVAHGRFDDAIRTAQTMFAMSRHLAEHPCLISDLVGIAIAFIAVVPLEEMLGQPGCPNLYWALATLPDPLVPLDKAMEGERIVVSSVYRDLDESSPMDADQLRKFVAELDPLFQSADGKFRKPGERVRDWLDARTKDKKAVEAARRRLVERGIPEDRLKRFPIDQVILMDEKRECEDRFDDTVKISALPTWQIEAMLARNKAKKEPALFADIILPFATIAVHRAQGRLDQRLAMLRTVEALRLYAAEHLGKLPAKLSDVTVPLSDDPFTGKPFRYELKDGTAHLRGTPPAGEEKSPFFNMHYELTMRN